MPITQLPTPPSRADSTNFAARADSLLAALPTFVTEANALQSSVETNKNYVSSAWDAAGGISVGLGQAIAAAASAIAARDKALAAWSASTAPVEQLASFNPSLHLGAVVKSIIYDTAKDSDGGAWRKRCTDKSWYTETIYPSSSWVGQQASVAAAWALGGFAMFQASTTTGPITTGKFYIATSSTGVTEVFRGISREFPAVVAIVAEASRVVIYDLTVSSCPMWMVLRGDLQYITQTSLACVNGKLLLGTTARVWFFDFAKDTVDRTDTGGTQRATNVIGGRNSAFVWGPSNSQILVSNTINDVAITVLDTAPIDPATGLPVPTIACLVGESLVTMADGSHTRIDQIEPTSKVKTLEGEATVTNWWDQGIKEVFEFKFDGGQKLICTADHKIRTTTGWVEAGSLTAEHEVVGL
jgi:trimeric autotransporter adhesin